VASTKLYNLKFNWRKALALAPGMTLTGIGATTNTWIMMLAGLALIAQLRDAATVHLEREHGIVAATLLVAQPVSRKELLMRLQEARSDEKISQEVADRIIQDLISISAVEITNSGLIMKEQLEIRTI